MSAYYGATGPIAQYNSLQDKHLEHFFHNPRIQRDLRKAGLITRGGYIVDGETYRRKLAEYDQRKRERELIAKVHLEKTLEIERQRKLEIRRRLEEFTKLEIVRRVKGTRYTSQPSPVLGPSPYQSMYEEDDSVNSVDSVLHENTSGSGDGMAAGLSVADDSALYRIKDDTNVTYYHDNRMPRLPCHPTSPYQNAYPRTVFLNPVDPGIESWLRRVQTSKARARRLMGRSREQIARQHSAPTRYSSRGEAMPTVSSRSASSLFATSEALLFKRSQKHSLAEVKLIYLGKSLSLGGPVDNNAREVVVLQQHCGGNTVCLYKGHIKAKDTFKIVSRRHRGNPFALTIYVDGMQDVRLSVCCEYKYQAGKILGGKNGHFGLVSVQGAAPCYKCQIAKEQKTASQPDELEPRPSLDSIGSLLRMSSAVGMVDDDGKEPEESPGVNGEQEEAGGSAAAAAAAEDDSKPSDISSLAGSIEVDRDEQSPQSTQTVTSTTEPPEHEVEKAKESTVEATAEEKEEEKEQERGEEKGGAYSDDEFEEDREVSRDEKSTVEESKAENRALSRSPSESSDSSDSSSSDSDEEEYSQSFYSDKQSASLSDSLPPDEEKADSEEDSEHEDDKENEEDGGRKMLADNLFNSGRFDGDLSRDGTPPSTRSPSNSSLVSKHLQGSKQGDETIDHSQKEQETSHTNIEHRTNNGGSELPLSVSDRNSISVQKVPVSEDGEKEVTVGMSNESPPAKEESSHSEAAHRRASSLGDEEKEERSPSPSSGVEEASDKRESAAVDNEEADKREDQPQGENNSNGQEETDVKEGDFASRDSAGEVAGEGTVDTNPDGDEGRIVSPVVAEKEAERSTEDGDDGRAMSTDQAVGNVPDKMADKEERKSNDRMDNEPQATPISAKEEDVESPVDGADCADEANGDSPKAAGVVAETRVGSRPSRSTIDISAIAHHSDKKEVDLQSIDLSTEQVSQLAAVVVDNKELSSLVLRNTAMDDDKATIVSEALQTCPGSVKMLNLSLNQLGPKGAESIASAIRNKGSNLNFLLMHGNPIGDDGLQSIVDAVLKVDAPTRAAPLTVLHLGDCQLTDGSADSLAALICHCPTIEELDLSANRFTPAGLEVIGNALQMTTSLRSLSLEFCGIGDNGMKKLCSGLRKNKSVQSLDLESTGLSDNGVQCLLNVLAENKTLQSINLSHNSISAQCWQEIKMTLQGRLRRKSID